MKPSWLLIVLLSVSIGCQEKAQPPTSPAPAALPGTPASPWTVAEGARSGDGPSSRVELIDGGVALTGDALTQRWSLLTRKLEAKEPGVYSVKFETRHSGLKREEKQFSSAYVKVGHALIEIESGKESEWVPHQLVFRFPANAATEIHFFLSKTGRIELRGLEFRRREPAESFDLLAEMMARYYSYFDHKKIDWPALTARFREAAVAAPSPDRFAEIVRDMLAELQDLHVRVITPKGRPLETFNPPATFNIDIHSVLKELPRHDVFESGKIVVGETADGIAYLGIGTLAMDDKSLGAILADITSRFKAKGYIIDLRGNSGGDERRALAIASLFTDADRVYAGHRVRTGPVPSDLSAPIARRMTRTKERYAGRVVCLLGPGCVSSGEGMAKMFAAMPHVLTLGQPTRGASGNPAPVELPNGVTVWFSRWVDLLPDGTCPEGKGLQPDGPVVHSSPGDPTFDAAVRLIRFKKGPLGVEPAPRPGLPNNDELVSRGWKPAKARAAELDGAVMICVVGRSEQGERRGELPLVGGIMRELEEHFSCLMGTLEELDGPTAAAIERAGVTKGPAIVFIDPKQDLVLDVTVGELMPLEIMELMQAVARGDSQAALAREVQDRPSPEASLKLGFARLRADQKAKAQGDFEAAAQSRDARVQRVAQIGLVYTDLLESRPEQALKSLEEVISQFVEIEERADFNSPLALAYYCRAKAAAALGKTEIYDEAYARLRNSWPMSPWMHRLHQETK